MNSVKLLRLGLIFFLVSCKTTDPSHSETKHDAGRFQNASNLSQWADISEADYLRLSKDEKFLPSAHPLTVRMQFWADQIRSVMIKSTPDIARVPRPIVRIALNALPNAFVESKPSRVTVAIKAASAIDTMPISAFLNRNYLRNTSTGELQFKGPIESSLDAADFNLRLKRPACKTSRDGNTLIIQDDCLMKSESAKKYVGITIPQQINYFTYLSGLIQKQTEGEAVATLGHELGHYYMAHELNETGYNYFYQNSQEPNAGKPKPITLTNDELNNVKKMDGIDEFNYPKFKGQRYPTALVVPLVESLYSRMVGKIPNDSDCLPGTKTCIQDFKELAASTEILRNIVNPDDRAFKSFNPTSELDNKAYATFEAALVKVGSNFPAGFASMVPRILNARLKGEIPAFEGNIDKMNLLEYLDAYRPLMEQGLAVHQKMLDVLQKEMFAKNIGYYTVEQEADDIAIEVLTELGFDPSVAVQAELTIMANHKELDLEACQKNYATGFKTPVWIGRFDDDHHSGCFRPYNIYKEYNNHKSYFESKRNPSRPTPPGTQSWESLVGSLKDSDYTLVK